MARISEEQKNTVARYANQIGANLQASAYCQTNAEADAVYECTKIVKANHFLYLKAVYEAPHNVEYNEKQREVISGDRETVVAMQQLYPVTSDVKTVKKEINDLCRKILAEAGSIGKKRIDKMIIGLRSTLTDEEEEFERSHKYTPEFIQFLKDLGMFIK